MPSRHDETAKMLERILREELKPSAFSIRNDSHLHAGHAGAQSGGGHFHVEICSAKFNGLSPLARQRLVLAVVAPYMDKEIHAFSMRCLPE